MLDGQLRVLLNLYVESLGENRYKMESGKKSLAKKEEFVCQMIWGCVPIDIVFVRNSNLFVGGLKRFENEEWKELWEKRCSAYFSIYIDPNKPQKPDNRTKEELQKDLLDGINKAATAIGALWQTTKTWIILNLNIINLNQI